MHVVLAAFVGQQLAGIYAVARFAVDVMLAHLGAEEERQKKKDNEKMFHGAVISFKLCEYCSFENLTK